MKLTRAQKASLLKEIGNLISYFDTIDNMDVEKFINIMKEKYASWKDVNATDVYDDVNDIVLVIQNILEEKVVDIIGNKVDVKPFDTNVTITGSDVSTAGEATFFEDEEIVIKKDLEDKDHFSFTGFSTDDFQQTNAISITPGEFWSDEEAPSTDNEYFK